MGNVFSLVRRVCLPQDPNMYNRFAVVRFFTVGSRPFFRMASFPLRPHLGGNGSCAEHTLGRSDRYVQLDTILRCRVIQ